MIGNSRLHWAQFQGSQLLHSWDTSHLTSEDVQLLVERGISCPTPVAGSISLLVASVVPDQSALWRSYPEARFLTLEQIPLAGMYSTLGIDRALAVLGATAMIGSPVLVIDAGTALTLNGADNTGFVGGAILPGLRLQFQSLGQFTAALPVLGTEDARLPSHWATNTHDAIISGIVYTLLASIQHFVDTWWQQFPRSAVVMTGGDSRRLHRYLTQHIPQLATAIQVEPNLIFFGMNRVRERNQ